MRLYESYGLLCSAYKLGNLLVGTDTNLPLISSQKIILKLPARFPPI